jgi:hypothetical protein
VINRVKLSVANARGDGSMSQTVSADLDSGDAVFSAWMNYNNIVLDGTVPVSGNYAVTVEGVPEDVPFNVLAPGGLYYTDQIP